MDRLPESRLAQEFNLDAFADPSSVRDVVRGILHTIFFHRYFPTIAPQTRDVLDVTLPYVAEPELETLIDQRTGALVRDLFAVSATATTPSTSTSDPAASPPPAPPPPALPAAGAGAAAAAPVSYAQSLPQQGKAALGAMLSAVSGAAAAAAAVVPSASAPGGAGGGGGGGGGRGRVTVQFMEKTKAGRRRIGMWGGKGEEEVCWESWTVRVTVAEPKTESERAKVRQAAASTLHTTIMKIISFINTHKDHIPPITIQNDTNPFPYVITVNQRHEAGIGVARGFKMIF